MIQAGHLGFILFVKLLIFWLIFICFLSELWINGALAYQKIVISFYYLYDTAKVTKIKEIM